MSVSACTVDWTEVVTDAAGCVALRSVLSAAASAPGSAVVCHSPVISLAVSGESASRSYVIVPSAGVVPVSWCDVYACADASWLCPGERGCVRAESAGMSVSSSFPVPPSVRTSRLHAVVLRWTDEGLCELGGSLNARSSKVPTLIVGAPSVS